MMFVSSWFWPVMAKPMAKSSWLPWTSSKFEDDQCLEPNDAHLELATPEFEEAHLIMTNLKWSPMPTTEKRQTLFNYMLVITSSVTNSKWSPSAPPKNKKRWTSTCWSPFRIGKHSYASVVWNTFNTINNQMIHVMTTLDQKRQFQKLSLRSQK